MHVRCELAVELGDSELQQRGTDTLTMSAQSVLGQTIVVQLY